MSDIREILDALAEQIDDHIGGTVDPIEDLQVNARMHHNPTPPAIDVYPASPFQVSMGYGRGNREIRLVVRALVTTADHEAGQDLLLQMMDPQGVRSLESAIMYDRTLGGLVSDLAVTEDGPSDYGKFPFSDGDLLGATWIVRVIP